MSIVERRTNWQIQQFHLRKMGETGKISVESAPHFFQQNFNAEDDLI